MSDPREEFERKCNEIMPNIELGERWGHAYRTPFIDALWQGFQMAWTKPETTHYAVIDEHGEIVQAFKIASYRDAKFLCENLVMAMSSHDHDTSGWTVKGVTVHE